MKWKLTILLLGYCFALDAIASPLWVQESWAPVYTQPDKVKPLTHWTVNTPVELLGQEKDWCLAKTLQGQSGYIACISLGPEKITSATGPMMQFWLQPSLGNWIAAGHYLEDGLSQEIKTLEFEDLQARRHPMPEFDAMKERMKQWVAPNYTPLPDLNSENYGVEAWPVAGDFDISGKNTLLNPATAKPSLFKKQHDIELVTNTNIENIAIISHAQIKASVARPGYVEAHHNSTQFVGFWDAGNLAIELSQPATYHTLSANGLLSAKQGHKYLLNFSNDQSCYSGRINLLLDDLQILKNYPKISSPVVGFYLAAPFPVKKVNVVQRSKSISYTSNQEEVKSVTVQYEFDLNLDGIADIVSQKGEIMKSDDLYPWSADYVNINGTWYRAAYFEEPECT